MNKRLGYFPDHKHKLLWIIIPKCGSHTVQRCANTLDRQIEYHEARMLDYFTISVIRHPYDRVVSALYTVLRDSTPFNERMMRYCEGRAPIEMNTHVRPCWHWFENMRVDVMMDLKFIKRDMARLKQVFPHINLPEINNAGKVRPHDWRKVGYDWSRVQELYQRDLDLCRALSH